MVVVMAMVVMMVCVEVCEVSVGCPSAVADGRALEREAERDEATLVALEDAEDMLGGRGRFRVKGDRLLGAGVFTLDCSVGGQGVLMGFACRDEYGLDPGTYPHLCFFVAHSMGTSVVRSIAYLSH